MLVRGVAAQKSPLMRGGEGGGCEGSGSVSGAVGGLGITRHGLNVLDVDASAVGTCLLLLKLELELEELDFLLLAKDGEFGLAG